MEWYHIKIKWWFGDTELHYTHCVIPAKSYGEALDEVLKDYGQDEIEEIKMWQEGRTRRRRRKNGSVCTNWHTQPFLPAKEYPSSGVATR